MFHFSVFVFGKLSRHQEPVNRERLNELIRWAIDNEWGWSASVA